MEFSGKMWFMIILKVTKNQGFTFSLENAVFKKNRGGRLTPPTSHFRVKLGATNFFDLKARNFNFSKHRSSIFWKYIKKLFWERIRNFFRVDFFYFFVFFLFQVWKVPSWNLRSFLYLGLENSITQSIRKTFLQKILEIFSEQINFFFFWDCAIKCVRYLLNLLLNFIFRCNLHELLDPFKCFNILSPKMINDFTFTSTNIFWICSFLSIGLLCFVLNFEADWTYVIDEGSVLSSFNKTLVFRRFSSSVWILPLSLCVFFLIF